MGSSLLNSEIEAYSLRFARKVCDGFFERKKVVSGEDILNLTPISQINLFAVRALNQNWRKQKDLLFSPYFDYEDAEVKQHLRRLLNILSKRIRIKREDFEPLLSRAVSDTIRLVFSPYDFYLKSFSGEDDQEVELADLQEDLKYIRVNNGLLARVVEILQGKGKKVVGRAELGEALDKALQSTEDSPHDPDSFLSQFSQIETLTTDQVYANAAKAQPKPSQGSSSNVNSRFSGSESETLNDHLTGEKGKTLASMHESKKIDNLLASISVNQRYMFVNELFSGDANQFREAFEKLEGLQSYQEAVDALNSSYAGINSWDLDSPPYLELLGILNKRYN